MAFMDSFVWYAADSDFPLIQRYDDNTKLDDSCLSLGFQSRVRRVATG